MTLLEAASSAAKFLVIPSWALYPNDEENVDNSNTGTENNMEAEEENEEEDQNQLVVLDISEGNDCTSLHKMEEQVNEQNQNHLIAASDSSHSCIITDEETDLTAKNVASPVHNVTEEFNCLEPVNVNETVCQEVPVSSSSSVGAEGNGKMKSVSDLMNAECNNPVSSEDTFCSPSNESSCENCMECSERNVIEEHGSQHPDSIQPYPLPVPTETSRGKRKSIDSPTFNDMPSAKLARYTLDNCNESEPKASSLEQSKEIKKQLKFHEERVQNLFSNLKYQFSDPLIVPRPQSLSFSQETCSDPELCLSLSCPLSIDKVGFVARNPSLNVSQGCIPVDSEMPSQNNNSVPVKEDGVSYESSCSLNGMKNNKMPPQYVDASSQVEEDDQLSDCSSPCCSYNEGIEDTTDEDSFEECHAIAEGKHSQCSSKESLKSLGLLSSTSGVSSLDSSPVLPGLLGANQWECQGCYVRNDNSVNICPCCQTERISKKVSQSSQRKTDSSNSRTTSAPIGGGFFSHPPTFSCMSTTTNNTFTCPQFPTLPGINKSFPASASSSIFDGAKAPNTITTTTANSGFRFNFFNSTASSEAASINANAFSPFLQKSNPNASTTTAQQPNTTQAEENQSASSGGCVFNLKSPTVLTYSTTTGSVVSPTVGQPPTASQPGWTFGSGFNQGISSSFGSGFNQGISSSFGSLNQNQFRFCSCGEATLTTTHPNTTSQVTAPTFSDTQAIPCNSVFCKLKKTPAEEMPPASSGGLFFDLKSPTVSTNSLTTSSISSPTTGQLPAASQPDTQASPCNRAFPKLKKTQAEEMPPASLGGFVFNVKSPTVSTNSSTTSSVFTPTTGQQPAASQPGWTFGSGFNQGISSSFGSLNQNQFRFGPCDVKPNEATLTTTHPNTTSQVTSPTFSDNSWNFGATVTSASNFPSQQPSVPVFSAPNFQFGKPSVTSTSNFPSQQPSVPVFSATHFQFGKPPVASTSIFPSQLPSVPVFPAPNFEFGQTSAGNPPVFVFTGNENNSGNQNPSLLNQNSGPNDTNPFEVQHCRPPQQPSRQSKNKRPRK